MFYMCGNILTKKTILTSLVGAFLLFAALGGIIYRFTGFSHETMAGRCKKTKPKLIIDHDGGADDSMAIFMSLLYEKYFDGPQVLGLTTTHGNVNESQVFKNSQRILDTARRRDVPIYRGSNHSLVINEVSDYYYGYDGLGDNATVQYEAIEAAPESATQALIRFSKEYEGRLVVIAIGSLTNIALAISLDPGFIGRLSHLYVGAGNVYSTNHSEPEFNANMDVESYYIVTKNARTDKVTILPFSQVQDSLDISREWRVNVLGAIPTEIMRAQNVFEQISLKTSDLWVQLDPVVAAVTLHHQVAEVVNKSENSIILCGSQRGINTNDFSSSKPNINLVYSYNKEEYKTFLFDVFSAELRGAR